MTASLFHREVFDAHAAGHGPTDFMYEVSIATDYAVAFAATVIAAVCRWIRARKMVKIVDYLNSDNAPYRIGKVFVGTCWRTTARIWHITCSPLPMSGIIGRPVASC